jgi:hypothetical protein
VSLPRFLRQYPFPPACVFDKKRTSGTLNGDKSRLDGDLDYFEGSRLVAVLQSSSLTNVLPMRHLEISFSTTSKAIRQRSLGEGVLTTLGDGQGLAGMNILHFGRIALSWMEEVEIRCRSTRCAKIKSKNPDLCGS